MRWFESSRTSQFFYNARLAVLAHIYTGPSPSGKATGFDPVMRWFESSRTSQLFAPHNFPKQIPKAPYT
jgi:hypothetical protein